MQNLQLPEDIKQVVVSLKSIIWIFKADGRAQSTSTQLTLS